MESTRIPETTKSSREILKHIDQLVKSNNLEKALQEVKKARKLDPKNIYAFAYEERIQELFIQQQHKNIDPLAHSKYVDTSGRVLTPYNLNRHILSDRTDSNGMKVPALYEEFKKAGLRSGDSIESINRASKEALETYKQALLLVWSDGQKTEEEICELQDLRQSLSITAQEDMKSWIDKQNWNVTFFYSSTSYNRVLHDPKWKKLLLSFVKVLMSLVLSKR